MANAVYCAGLVMGLYLWKEQFRYASSFELGFQQMFKGKIADHDIPAV